MCGLLLITELLKLERAFDGIKTSAVRIDKYKICKEVNRLENMYKEAIATKIYKNRDRISIPVKVPKTQT